MCEERGAPAAERLTLLALVLLLLTRPPVLELLVTLVLVLVLVLRAVDLRLVPMLALVRIRVGPSVEDDGVGGNPTVLPLPLLLTLPNAECGGVGSVIPLELVLTPVAVPGRFGVRTKRRRDVSFAESFAVRSSSGSVLW